MFLPQSVCCLEYSVFIVKQILTLFKCTGDMKATIRLIFQVFNSLSFARDNMKCNQIVSFF